MVSQLDQDTSTVLASIREWRNSFVPINRFPLEVLCLVPTNLSSETDVIHAGSVCRHWRKTFNQHAALWSKLDLSLKRTRLFVETRLERAKGAPLDITSAYLGRAEILGLLSPHAQQFRSLNIVFALWSHIQKLSEAASGPLPLLQELNIRVIDFDPLAPEEMNHPSLPLFAGATNLKKFHLHSDGLPYLDHFTFPNLTTFQLFVIPEEEAFHVSQLLDFLGATPTLQDVYVSIQAESSLAGVPPGRVVVLPNVERLSVIEEEPGYDIAAHLSCPSAKHAWLIQERVFGDPIPPEAFPVSATWNAIPPQYMADQIDEVQLWIEISPRVSCHISFISSDSTVLELGHSAAAAGDEEEPGVTPGQEYVEVLSQASRSIRTHPLLANVKRLTIDDLSPGLTPNELTGVANEVGQLFKSMGRLEKLTLSALDLQPYLAPFIDLPEFDDVKQSYAYPRIDSLTIGPERKDFQMSSKAAIVEFAKSQHALGVPFDRVEFRTEETPTDMVELLQPWVGAVNSCGS